MEDDGSAHSRWIVCAPVGLTALKPFVLVISEATLQAELAVEVLARSEDLPGLHHEVPLLGFQAVPTTIHSAEPQVAIELLDLVHEVDKSTTTKWPFPKEISSITDDLFQEGDEVLEHPSFLRRYLSRTSGRCW